MYESNAWNVLVASSCMQNVERYIVHLVMKKQGKSSTDFINVTMHGQLHIICESIGLYRNDIRKFGEEISTTASKIKSEVPRFISASRKYKSNYSNWPTRHAKCEINSHESHANKTFLPSFN